MGEPRIQNSIALEQAVTFFFQIIDEEIGGHTP